MPPYRPQPLTTRAANAALEIAELVRQVDAARELAIAAEAEARAAESSDSRDGQLLRVAGDDPGRLVRKAPDAVVAYQQARLKLVQLELKHAVAVAKEAARLVGDRATHERIRSELLHVIGANGNPAQK